MAKENDPKPEPYTGWGFGKKEERSTCNSILDSRSMTELWKQEQKLAEEGKTSSIPVTESDPEP